MREAEADGGEVRGGEEPGQHSVSQQLRLQHVYGRKEKGPVTALTTVGGTLASALGNKASPHTQQTLLMFLLPFHWLFIDRFALECYL